LRAIYTSIVNNLFGIQTCTWIMLTKWHVRPKINRFHSKTHEFWRFPNVLTTPAITAEPRLFRPSHSTQNKSLLHRTRTLRQRVKERGVFFVRNKQMMMIWFNQQLETREGSISNKFYQ
jgi:hypothetical protein